MKRNIVLILISFIFIININISFSLPVALIHGFRQSCADYDLESLEQYIGYKTREYSRCIETGGGSIDISRSFEDQAKKACELISKDEHYNGDFALVSISQGGILARYVIEKCNTPGKVKVFVSIGGPLAGTHQLPHCFRGVICHLLNSLGDWFVYKGYVQKTLGPAGYFRVSNHIENYYKSNSLLLDVNNEGKTIDEEAKRKFSSLDKLVLIAFKRDTMISPRESAFFYVYDKEHKLVNVNDTDIYKKDLFGLRTLEEQKKIKHLWIDENHCWYNFDDIDKTVIPFVTNNS